MPMMQIFCKPPLGFRAAGPHSCGNSIYGSILDGRFVIMVLSCVILEENSSWPTSQDGKTLYDCFGSVKSELCW